MSDPPAPLVPADVDLRDYDYIPLYGDKLFNSDTWALCDADEKVAALRLWWKSWHEEPSGSLPDNDRLLAERAGYGVAVKAFLAVKKNAMRGWILCSDGRLYHPVVASIALDVWAKMRRKRTENAADRERKRIKREAMSGGQNANVRRTDGQFHPDTPECPPDTPPDTAEIPPENTLKERKVKGKEGTPPPIVPPLSGNGLQSAGQRRKPRQGFPPDWQPSERGIEFAHTEGRSDAWIASEAPRCRDHHIAKGSLFADIDAAWRTWVRNATQFEGSSQPRKRSAVEKLYAGAMEAADELTRRQQANGGPDFTPLGPLLDRG